MLHIQDWVVVLAWVDCGETDFLVTRKRGRKVLETLVMVHGASLIRGSKSLKEWGCPSLVSWCQNVGKMCWVVVVWPDWICFGVVFAWVKLVHQSFFLLNGRMLILLPRVISQRLKWGARHHNLRILLFLSHGLLRRLISSQIKPVLHVDDGRLNVWALLIPLGFLLDFSLSGPRTSPCARPLYLSSGALYMSLIILERDLHCGLIWNTHSELPIYQCRHRWVVLQPIINGRLPNIFFLRHLVPLSVVMMMFLATLTLKWRLRICHLLHHLLRHWL
jgi:hypothetical protein